jgi:rod shape-determining protein MreC
VAPSRHPGRSRFTLIVLVLVSITIITLDFRGFGPLEGLKSGVNSVFSPVRAVGDAVFGPIGNAWEGIFGGGDLADENERLRRENAELRGAAALGEEAQAQVDAMRETLGLEFREDIPRTHAEIVGTVGSNFDRTIRIDKGTNAGIKVGNPVVTSAGLVGRVVEVSYNQAIVEVITDPSLRIGVRHSLSRDIGVARGRGEGEPLLVDVGIDVDTEVGEDDVFVTSGVERALYPDGLPVGRVSRLIPPEENANQDEEIEQGATGPTEQSLELEPLADLDHLTFVSVLRWQPQG